MATRKVEALGLDRLEQVTQPELDDVDAVEGGVEPGELRTPACSSRGNDWVRVLPREQCLDPAAGAEVQRCMDRPSHRQLRERDGRRVDSGHPVSGFGRSPTRSEAR